jgi:hypothetical protein
MTVSTEIFVLAYSLVKNYTTQIHDNKFFLKFPCDNKFFLLKFPCEKSAFSHSALLSHTQCTGTANLQMVRSVGHPREGHRACLQRIQEKHRAVSLINRAVVPRSRSCNSAIACAHF